MNSTIAYNMFVDGHIISSANSFWNSYMPGWFVFVLFAITMLMMFLRTNNSFVVLSLSIIFLVLIGIQNLAKLYFAQYALTLTIAIGVLCLFSAFYTVFYKGEVI